MDPKAAIERDFRSSLVPSIEQRRLRTYIAIMLADIAAMLGSFALVGALYLDWRPIQTALGQAYLLLPLYLTLALYERAYSIRALESAGFAIRRAISALVFAALLLLTISFFAKSTTDFSRVVAAGGLACTAVCLAAIRWAVAKWVEATWGGSASNVLLFDAGGPPTEIPHALRIDVVAIGLAPDRNDPHALDRIGRLLANADRVVVSCPPASRLAWAHVLRAAGAWGEIVTDQVTDLQPIGLTVEGSSAALVVSSGPLGLQQRAIKRAFDLIVASAALAVLAMPMLALALAIRLADGGPAFFVQRRLGHGNQFFGMIKFRSMYVAQEDEDGTVSTAHADDRVTPIGRLIRRTSIDELPQLINVLRGEMSMVGPRPHAIGSLAGRKLFGEVDGAYWQRHSLKPGITGLAQVRGQRGTADQESDLADRLQSDLEYLRGWTIMRDAVILLRTFRVLSHRRAF